MNVLVIGATGKTGQALVRELLAGGHQVTAFARRPETITIESPRLRRVRGDAMNATDLEQAVKGQDAVAVILGISENPLLVRLRGTRHTPLDIRSRGTQNVIAAMRTQGVSKLIVQTTYGIGESKGRLSLKWRILFSMLLKPQIADSDRQEQFVRESGLDWTLVQPVSITDTAAAADAGAGAGAAAAVAAGDTAETAFVSTEAEARTMNVSRTSVAKVLAEIIETHRYRGTTVAISAAA